MKMYLQSRRKCDALVFQQTDNDDTENSSLCPAQSNVAGEHTVSKVKLRYKSCLSIRQLGQPL